jgi:predicted secreted protein
MNPRLGVIAVTTAALAGSFASAASAQPAQNSAAQSSAAQGSAIRVIHYSDSGKTIVVKEGKTFEVKLEACGDCGSRWSFAHRPRNYILGVTGNKTVPEAKPPLVGGNDHQVFSFKAKRNGKTTMRLVERSAEKNNTVIKRFTLTVKVPEPIVSD